MRFHQRALLAVAALAFCMSGSIANADEPLLYPSTGAEFTFPTASEGDITYQTSQIAYQYKAEESPSDQAEERVKAIWDDSTPIYEGSSRAYPRGIANQLPGQCNGPGCQNCGRGYGYGCSSWQWGCGSSPFRTGPGWCDDWRVGPIWDAVVDGTVMFREDADLAALESVTNLDSDGNTLTPLITEQFGAGAGGRLYLTGRIPDYVGYQLQFGYAGVEEWNAEIVYPKVQVQPNVAYPAVDETRAVYYRSALHSAEINFIRTTPDMWKPFLGIRYILVDDDIRDQINQEAPPLLPGAPPVPDDAVEMDMVNAVDVKNHMIGTQIGLRRDLWQYGQWLTLQGFVSGGVYYNKVKRTDRMRMDDTLIVAEDTSTTDIEALRSTSTSATYTTSELSDVAFVGDLSLTAVCRLNRCVALRGGYQLLLIDGAYLAEDAFLRVNNVSGYQFDSQSMLYHGWHAGIEYRR